MQRARLMIKRIEKDKLMLILTVLLFLLTLGYMVLKIILYHASTSSPLSYLSATLDMSMIAFVFFMFLSYEFLCRIKQQFVEEVLKSTDSGYKSFYLTGMFILVSLLAIYTLLVLIVNLIVYFCLDVSNFEYLNHIVLNVFLNMFLVPLVGILVGAAVSFSKRRISAYVVMLVAVFFSTPMFTAITDAIYEGTGKDLALLRGIFDIFPPSLGYIPIYSFGYSILPYRWDIVCFWLCLFAAVISFRLSGVKKTKGILTALICIALSVLSIVGYFKPASKPILRKGVDSSGIADMTYYSSVTQRRSETDFEIKKYSLSLKIERRLSCEATLFLSRDDLSFYRFTLYHGYNVKDVKLPSGKELRYEQDGDYITVYKADEPTQSITIRYSGSAPRFFSNSQGTNLPGWFAYYPHAGEKELYDSSVCGFNRILCPKNTQFEIDISSNKVYCSLDKQGEKYVGTTDGVTIVSGFYDTLMYGKMQVIYPFLDSTEFAEENIKEKLAEYFDSGVISADSKKLIIIANLNMTSVYERYCLFSDHTAVSQFNGLSDFYETQKVPSYKLSLYNAFDYYCNDKESWIQLIDMFRNDFYANDEEMLQNDPKILLQTAFEELGENYTAKMVSEYLCNDEDTRGWKAFLKDLRGEE